jgi:hypothetical protein
MNLPITLNRNGGAELFQQIERIARRRWPEGLDSRPTASVAGAPLHGLCRAVHCGLHQSRVARCSVYRGASWREIR